MTKERFTALLTGFIQQTLTNEEITEFLEEAGKPIHQETLEQALDRDLHTGVYNGIAGKDQAAAAFRTLADSIGIAKQMEVDPINSGEAPKPINTREEPKRINSGEEPKPINIAARPKRINSGEEPKPINAEASPKPINNGEAPEPINTEVSPKPINTEASPKRISLPLQWAAAAAVILLIAGGSWLLYSKRDQGGDSGTKGLQLSTNDLLPGSNKAVLTLADGRRIELDTSRTGQLAQQGTMKIVKAGNGVLNYEAMNGAGHIKSEPTYNTLTTPRGGQYQLTLPDGSKAWLNAASSIQYPTAFTGSERKVAITGEVYFEVADDAMRPFRVTNRGMIVDVLGTHFNVNAYEDEPVVRTTLSEGKLRVRQGGNSQLLSPGEQAVLYPSGEIKLEKETDLEKTMAWKNNEFIFERDELPEILRQLSRWYDVETEYRGPMKPYHFSGVISRARNASEVLPILEATGNIHFIIEGKKILVTP